MSTAAATPINDVAKNDYKVADISLADFGRREITLAEAEMPALMTLRKKYAAERPLAGAKTFGCIHMTVQPAVLSRRSLSLAPKYAGLLVTSSRHRTTPLRVSPLRALLFMLGRVSQTKKASGVSSKQFSKTARHGIAT